MDRIGGNVYIVDSEEFTTKEKLNLEYLDLFPDSFCRAFISSSDLQNLFNEYQRIVNNYNIDSTTPILQLAISEIRSWPFEKEIISEKISPCIYYSRGNFFKEIQEAISNSSNKLLDLNKYLKALKNINFIHDVESADDCMDFFNFLIGLIKSTFPDNYELLTEFLLLFSTCSYIVEDIFYLLPGYKLEFLLNCARKQKINFRGIWQSNQHSALNLFYTMSSQSYDNFVVILDIGAKNVYSNDAYEKLYEVSNWPYRFNVEEFWKETKSTRRNFLILEVLRLYEDSNDEDYTEVEVNPLIALWNIITDPYLSKTEILNFASAFPEICETFFMDCWLWYTKNLNIPSSCSHSNSSYLFINPRSLKHLAKCAIRSHLAENFLIPSDVNWKGSISKALQDYLITISSIDSLDSCCNDLLKCKI